MLFSPLVTISVLPDDALLEVFKFYVDQFHHEDAWHLLVHVCRRWRCLVFASPRWLHLELRCTNRSPVKKMLDIWPAVPIVINASIGATQRWGLNNIVAALKRHNLVCRITIGDVPDSLLKSGVMKKRFSKLTHLVLRSFEENVPVIPDSFLDGSAPRLRVLHFRRIPFPFPALGKLLLSATNLVTLLLEDIPKLGYISSKRITRVLPSLTMLRHFSIGYRFPRSHADRSRQHPPLLKRLVLPSLTEFSFKGDSEYLENIVGRIDTPSLESVNITFFNQLIFSTPLLRDFFSRTTIPQEPHRAEIWFFGYHIDICLFQRERPAGCHMLKVVLLSRVPEWQLSSMAEFCSTSLPPLPTLERLRIVAPRPTADLPRDMESSQWLELVRSFVTVKDLDLSIRVPEEVVTALRELTGSTVTQKLSAL